ncbi:hypothetical protein [Clostridium sp. 001]|uniref:hypothetical protein n=1 Tax=Clostridium sp. 001 TaxID=1970093 RepID=UPI001C2BDCF0|nr:hypothetical protein [Clostridium sp. 001]QXE20465.1 hypothetical protein B5S50_17365 [Clostridium sp. 001]
MKRIPFTTTIDDNIQDKFRVTCTKNKAKMNDVLEAFMESYINGDFEIQKEVKFSLKKSNK